MRKNSRPTEAINAQLNDVMEAINAGLPTGFKTTNKKPIQKEIRLLTSATTDTLWTSWCKNDAGERFLALLQSDGVKLISQDELVNYQHRSVK